LHDIFVHHQDFLTPTGRESCPIDAAAVSCLTESPFYIQFGGDPTFAHLDNTEQPFLLLAAEVSVTRQLDLEERIIRGFLSSLEYLYSQLSHCLLLEVNSLNNYELPS
jgi:hypothetical protein